jgi:rhamnosyltransferase
MNIPRVSILLAGYNGHRYIYEQIFSLLNQDGVDVEIFIRLDGQFPKFESVIKRLSLDNINIHYIKGDDVATSSGENFYQLVFEMNNHAPFDYYAFCDQDDIWCNDKLISAVRQLEDGNFNGYSSGFTAFNSRGDKRSYNLGSQTNYDYFFQAGGPGCSIVLSQKGFVFFQKYLNQNPELLLVLAHDWLVYFVIRFNDMGWIMDPNSRFFYRQHSSNVAGVNRGFLAKFKRLKLLFNGWYVSDLNRLTTFSKLKGVDFTQFHFFKLRRSGIHSIGLWLYFWLYINPFWRQSFNGEQVDKNED